MNSFTKLTLFVALLACTSTVSAQLPNEKFGKPSQLEWDFVGWGSAVDADAIILSKTLKVTYQISDQVSNYNESFSDVSAENITDFGKNQIDEGNILVKYEVGLRTKILKPSGASHTGIDITYYNVNDDKLILRDEVDDLKITVFTRNEKGKVVKRKINTRSFASERIDNNYMVLHVTVPDVEAGSIVEYQYSITSTRPTFLYDWVFQESIPTVHSKCDIDVPAFLQFKMNTPINKLIKAGVEVGRLTYDVNRTDLKKAKSFPTNHYTIQGDYILPEGYALKRSQDGTDEKKEAIQEEIAPFTSQIAMPNVTIPAPLPKGHTHLKLK